MKTVTIVVPAYNEAPYIAKCLASVQAFELRPGWAICEILVLDGGSTDSTCEIVKHTAISDRRIALLPNPGRFQVIALNIAINKAAGDFILRLDAHAVYPPEYLKKCIDVFGSQHADNVGGIVITKPGGSGYGALLVQALTTHRFGVGDSGFRLGVCAGKTDTVPYGFFCRKIFSKVGYFDERLLRAEDYEMNRRIAMAGGIVWLDPAIHATYFNKASIWAFLGKQFFSEAPYNAYLWYLAPYAFAWRHAIAAFFVLGIFLGILLWSWWFAQAVYVCVLALYVFLSLISSVQQTIRYSDVRHIIVLPLFFFVFHFLYGLGILWGLLRIATGTAPVQRDREPWRGAGQFRPWPPPNRTSWDFTGFLKFNGLANDKTTL